MTILTLNEPAKRLLVKVKMVYITSFYGSLRLLTRGQLTDPSDAQKLQQFIRQRIPFPNDKQQMLSKASTVMINLSNVGVLYLVVVTDTVIGL